MSEVKVQKEPGPVDTTTVEKVGGWQTLSSQKMYENPWISLHHQEVRRPNGSEGIYGLVHFKGHATGIVALDEDNNTWLVKQSRYTLNQFSIELPEGGGSRDEDPMESAKRELQEETGLIARHWEKILTLHLSNSVTDEVAHVYLATGLTQGEQNLDDSEDIEVIKLPFKEVVDMVMRGEITDSITVAAVLRVELAMRAAED